MYKVYMEFIPLLNLEIINIRL